MCPIIETDESPAHHIVVQNLNFVRSNMDGTLPTILAGLVLAVLILYLIQRYPRPVSEPYVQQPVHKGSPIEDMNELLIAVGLQTRYVESVMDASEISQDAWLRAQRAALEAAPPGTAPVQPQPQPQTGGVIQMGTAAPSSAWTAGGPVTVPVKPLDELVVPKSVTVVGATTGLVAAAAPAPSTAALAPPVDPAAEREAAYQRQVAADAIARDTQLKQADQAAVLALKLSYQNDFKNRWLTSNDNRTNPKVTTDTPATRTAFVAWLQAQYDQDKLNFDTTANPRETDPVRIDIRNQALKVFDQRKAAIAGLDSTWQSSSTIDCFPVPWASSSNNIADLPTDNYEVAIDCTKECGWGTMQARAKYQGPSGSPPGAACPPMGQRVTKNFNCKKAECTQTRSPASAQCAYSQGYEYQSAENKCVKPLNDINWTMTQTGCPPPWTYDATATVTVGGATVRGACKKTGSQNIAVTCPTGYKWNGTRLRCEIDPPMDPTWTCANSTDQLTSGPLPSCVGTGPDPTRRGTPYLRT